MEAIVLDWLLQGDPSIRWQVMRDLTDASDEEVAAERSRVATEGWGAQLLSLQGRDGQWAGGTYFPSSPPSTPPARGADGRLVGQPWTATFWSLVLLRIFGLDPESPEAQRAVAMVREHSRWEHAGQRFFDGEVEPCINGRTVAIGSYFGEDVVGIVDRLLDEQMADGGWNCEQETGSTRGSFHTTISVLEGLLEYEAANGAESAVGKARARGEEYLLERRMFRSLSSGEVINPNWLLFSFPTRWHYDVLRGMQYLAAAGVGADERAAEALQLVEQKRLADGRWLLENSHPGAVHFEMEEEGKPSRWNTLRAMRVLKWANHLDF